MEQPGLQSLLEKLDHPTEEIKCRALKSLSAKVRLDLLPSDCSVRSNIALKLLELLQQSPVPCPESLFPALKDLLQHEQIQQAFVSADGIAILLKLLSENSDEYVCKAINDILTSNVKFTPAFGQSILDPDKPPLYPSGYFFMSNLTSTYTHSTNQSGPSRTLWNATHVDRVAGTCTDTPRTEVDDSSTKHIHFSFPVVHLTQADVNVISASMKSIESDDEDSLLAGIAFFQDVMLEDFPGEIFLQRPAIVQRLLQLLTSTNALVVSASVEALIALCEKLILRIYYTLDPNHFVPQTGLTSPDISWETTAVPAGISATRAPLVSFVATTHVNLNGPSTSHSGSYTRFTAHSSGHPLLEFCSETLLALATMLIEWIGNHGSFKGPTIVAEPRVVPLLRAVINLLLTCVEPLERLKRVTWLDHTPDDALKALKSAVPSHHDSLNPEDLPISFLKSLQSWGIVLTMLSSTWMDDPHQSDSSWTPDDVKEMIEPGNFPCEHERHLYLGILTNIFTLVSSVFSPESAVFVIPAELNSAFGTALLDWTLWIPSSDPSLDLTLPTQGLSAYVALTQTDLVHAWQSLITLNRSVQALVNFLERMQEFDQNRNVELISESTLKLAILGVGSINIFGSIQFPTAFVSFLNQLCLHHQDLSPDVLWEGQLVLLRLLSDSHESVRKSTYAKLFAVVQDATDPRTVANPLILQNNLHFILYEQLFHEFVENGLHDADTEIQHLAEQLLGILLNSYGLLPQQSWQALYRMIFASSTHSVPLNLLLGPRAEAGQSNKTSMLGRVVLDWCTCRITLCDREKSASPKFPSESAQDDEWTQQLLGSCRLLFHPNHDVRQAVASILAHQFQLRLRHSPLQTTSNTSDSRWVTGASTNVQLESTATEEKARQTSTPIEDSRESLVQALTDCLLAAVPTTQPSPLLDRVGRLDDVDDLGDCLDQWSTTWNTLIDPEADLELRISAGERLNVLLRNHLVFQAWLNNKGLEISCRLIRDFSLDRTRRIPSPEDPPTDLTPDSVLMVLLKILCFAATWDSSVLKCLKDDANLLFSLIHIRLLVPDLTEHVSVLCALILFQPVICMSEQCPVSLPQIVREGYLIPFDCPTYSLRSQWQRQAHLLSEPFQPLLDLLSCPGRDNSTTVLQSLVRRNLRYMWSIAWHGGMPDFTKHFMSLLDMSEDSVETAGQKKMDRASIITIYQDHLSLTTMDLALFLTTHTPASVRLGLKAIRHATSHSTLERALCLIQRSVDTTRRLDKPDWWVYCQLDRFLSTLPTCSADYQTLYNLLLTIERIGLSGQSPYDQQLEFCTWLIKQVINTQGPLTHCLLQVGAGVGQTDSRRLTLSKKRFTYQRLPRLLFQLTNRLGQLLHPAQRRNRSDIKLISADLSNFVLLCLQWGSSELRQFITNPFSDLVRLQMVVGVLCNLTSPNLWQSKFNRPWLLVLLLLITHLLKQFDAGRDEGSHSFMGTRPLALLFQMLNQVAWWLTENPSLLRQLRPTDASYTLVREHVPDDMEPTHLLNWPEEEWLLRSLVYRPPEIRSLALCLLSHVSTISPWQKAFCSHSISPATRILLASHGLDLPRVGGRLWTIALSVLTNPKEPSLCHVQAAHLLIRLLSLPMGAEQSGLFLSPSLPHRPSASTDAVSADLDSYPTDSTPSTSETTDGLNSGDHAPQSAGDLPTSLTLPSSNDSSTIDLRQLFTSEEDSSELRENLSRLLVHLEPWFTDLLLQSAGTSQNDMSTNPWLIRTVPVPRDTALPCCFDEDTGFYLLGLPALHHLLMSQNIFKRIRHMLASYTPQPIMPLKFWSELNSLPQPNNSNASTSNTTSTTPHQNASTESGTLATSTLSSSQPIQTSTLCTPHLVHVLGRMLSNLMCLAPKLTVAQMVKQKINVLMMNIVDPSLFCVLLDLNKARSSTTHNLAQSPLWYENAIQLVSAFTVCLRVLRYQAVLETSVRTELCQDARFVARLIQSLTFTGHPDVLTPFWCELFTLLTCLLILKEDSQQEEPQQQADVRLRLILQPLASHLPQLIDVVISLIDKVDQASADANHAEELRACRNVCTCLQFFTVTISHYRPLNSNPVITSLDSETHSASVSRLAQRVMFALLEGSARSDDELGSLRRTSSSPRLPSEVLTYRRTLWTTLRVLLGVSQSAKSAALEAGLLEDLALNMQLVQTKMELGTLSSNSRQDVSSRSSTESTRQATAQWTSLLDDLIAQFELLYNLLFMSAEAKQRAVDLGLPLIMQRFWSLALQDVRIMHALLSLLTNMTADCPRASAQLANPFGAKPSGTNRTMPKNKASAKLAESFPTDTSGCASSLTQSVCCWLNIILSSHANSAPTQSDQEVTCRLSFELLGNMMWSPEACMMLLKSKLMQRFTAINVQNAVKSRRGQRVLSMWLQLLLTLSFTKDGQQVLLSHKSTAESLTYCLSQLKGHGRRMAGIAYRNLCINKAFKIRIISEDADILDGLRELLSRDGSVHKDQVVELGVSSVSALIHQNQKMKSLLQSAGFLHQLLRLYDYYQQSSHSTALATKIRNLVAQFQS